jgi:predicted DNA-binding transcriptional regulator
MDEKFIPDDVAQFVIDKLDSVAEFEALMLLRKHPNINWTPREIAHRLYISEQEGFDVLVGLSTKGLALYKASGTGWYEYQPGTPEVGRLVDRLCVIYAKQIVPITNLIHSKSKKRVQEFADAFKLRKDE